MGVQSGLSGASRLGWVGGIHAEGGEQGEEAWHEADVDRIPPSPLAPGSSRCWRVRSRVLD